MSNNLLEKAVLTKVEEFIKILIELSALKNEKEKKEFRKKGIEKCQEIIPLLLHFLEGKEQYVEPMIYQLVQEKLPTSIILNSFGQLQEELKIVVQQSIWEFKKNPQEIKTEAVTSIESEENKEENLEVQNLGTISDSPIYRILSKVFSNYKVIANYKIRGQMIDVYIPELQIAFTRELKPYSFARLNYVCQQENIKLLNIPDDLLSSQKKLSQFIKKQKLS